jgi:MscS family membrane protein
MDRTLVTIPNGQMASMTLENFSSRDNYCLRHVVGVSYDSASSSAHEVISKIANMLQQDRRVLPLSTRVRFIRFAESSLDIEVFAYVRARDWNHFLETQEDLLFQIREIIASAGLQIAFPSRTIYLKHESEEATSFDSMKQAASS